MSEKLFHTNEVEEKVILVGIDQNSVGMDTERCLEELEELAKTAGAVTVCKMIQKREGIHPAHYVGKGKLEEIAAAIAAFDATGIICDDELSPAQIKNLEQALHIKIMDRTMLILDIFAGRAISSEGKIQVELAQLKYRLSRLAGIGASMSRLGGGIGTRGPGEKKLETDRRYIKERIGELNRDLKDIETHRALLRAKRKKTGSPVVSLVGYTNAGKSTTLNMLTDAGVLAEDKLFATLDTTTRKLKLPGGTEVLLTDTVGFIQKLPHHLIQAFRATLEELTYADILLHVVDASNETRQEQMAVVYQTLNALGCEKTPVITVYNKMDLEVSTPLPPDHRAVDFVRLSAKTGEGAQELLYCIEELIKSFKKPIKVCIPYQDGHMLQYIYGKSEIIFEEHTEQGVVLEIFADEEVQNRLEGYKTW